MRSAKRHINPIDMEIIYRAYRSVWTVLNQEKRLTDSDEARDLSKVTQKKKNCGKGIDSKPSGSEFRKIGVKNPQKSPPKKDYDLPQRCCPPSSKKIPPRMKKFVW